MGETTPSLGSRARGAAAVYVLAIGVPIAALLPWGDRTLLTPGVLVAAFSLVHAMSAGWRRTLALLPALVVGTAGGALTAGTSAWPWFVAGLGMVVGLATRVGWGATAVIAGFIAVGVPPTPDGLPWSRLAVVAGVGIYGVAVARALRLPATLPGTQLTWPQSLLIAAVTAAAAGVAASLAQASGNPLGSWAPATLFLLVLPSGDLSLPHRAAHRVLGTVLGAGLGVAAGALLAVPPLVAGMVVLFLCLVVSRPMWASTTLSTTAVVLLLDSSSGAEVAAGTRLAAVATAAVLATAGTWVVSLLSRSMPADAVRTAEDASRAQRPAPVTQRAASP